MKYLDISVRNFSGHFTSNAKKLGLTKVSILEKCPRLDLTTVRLVGSTEAITLVLENQFERKIVDMHVRAIKDASPETLEPMPGRTRDCSKTEWRERECVKI